MVNKRIADSLLLLLLLEEVVKKVADDAADSEERDDQDQACHATGVVGRACGLSAVRRGSVVLEIVDRR